MLTVYTPARPIPNQNSAGSLSSYVTCPWLTAHMHQVLGVLDRFDAKATFFVISSHFEGREHMVADVVEVAASLSPLLDTRHRLTPQITPPSPY